MDVREHPADNIIHPDPGPQGTLSEHNSMMDYARSVDQIYKEGSNPSSKSRFKSSSARYPDSNE